MTDSLDRDSLLEVARAAAAAGSQAVVAKVGNHGEVRTKSSLTDPVTEADEAGEAAIRAVLATLRPDDAITGEEGDDQPGTTGLRWLIDPLDGTVNFLYGYPQWCVSVAVADSEGPLVGVVFDPQRGEEFATTRGGPLLLNGLEVERKGVHALGGSDDPLEGVMLATGFNYERPVRPLQGPVFNSLIPRVRDIRRGGSAALDLCWVALGRLDAYFEHGVRAWDVSAGALACLSSGLCVKTMPSRDGWPAGIAAGSEGVVDALVEACGAADSAGTWPAEWVA